MFKRVSDPAFEMDALILKDKSVRDYQFYSYEATAPNQRERIELQLQDTSRYFLPAETFLEVTGEIVTYVAANTPYGAEIIVGLVNNDIMALFSSASYNTDGREIEIIRDNVAVATAIIGLARYSDDYTRSAGPTMMFTKDNSDHLDGRPSIIRRQRNFADNADADLWPVVHNNPNYNLGFGSRKLMLSGDHTVVLYRKGDDNDVIWRTDGVAAGKVILSKLALWMPAMSPLIAEEQRLLLLWTESINHRYHG